MFRYLYVAVLFYTLVAITGCSHSYVSPQDEWKNMLDTNLSQWDKFIGVPHYSVDLPGYPKGDGMNGTPIGLNNDPLQVFRVEMHQNNPILHISGQIYGGLTTKQSYKNYHLKASFKWGEKKYEPRLNARRDNGILYHAYGKHGAFWNVWMKSNEMQVQEADMGDYYSLGPVAAITMTHKMQDNEEDWIYDPTAPYVPIGDGTGITRCRRQNNHESAHGEWNILELICYENTCIHVVNGVVVNVIKDSRIKDAEGNMTPLNEGYIQIQCEGAEAYYKDIWIKNISAIPDAYK